MRFKFRANGNGDPFPLVQSIDFRTLDAFDLTTAGPHTVNGIEFLRESGASAITGGGEAGLEFSSAGSTAWWINLFNSGIDLSPYVRVAMLIEFVTNISAGTMVWAMGNETGAVRTMGAAVRTALNTKPRQWVEDASFESSSGSESVPTANMTRSLLISHELTVKHSYSNDAITAGGGPPPTIASMVGYSRNGGVGDHTQILPLFNGDALDRFRIFSDTTVPEIAAIHFYGSMNQ